MKTKLIFVVALTLAGTYPAYGQTGVTLSGHLLGIDGKPMARGRVAIEGRSKGPETFTDDQGRFSLAIPGTGMVAISYSGVGHMSTRSTLLIEGTAGGTISVNVRLGAYERAGNLDSLRVIGDFNEWDHQSGVPMRKGKGGLYTATFTAPKGAVDAKYQIVGLAPERSVNGTEGIRFDYDGGGDWQSVVRVRNGRVTVTFDPARMPKGNNEALVEYGDPFQREVQALTVRLRDHRRAIAQKKNDPASPVNITQRIHDNSVAIVDAPTEQIKRLYWMEGLALITWSGDTNNARAVREGLDAIGPESSIWELSPSVLPAAIEASQRPSHYTTYIDRFLAGQAGPDARAIVAYIMAYDARSKGDSAGVARYYAVLSGPLRETTYGRVGKTEFDPNRAIQTGRPVPDYRVAALGDQATYYSREGMIGKLYLIDFWATWCGPCVAEMPNLHKVYERFHPRGFEILSLSFDTRPDVIPPFRASKWGMPWLHTFVENGFASSLAESFEVLGIPKPILIDDKGNIIATEESLRGEELEKTLARLYGENP